MTADRRLSKHSFSLTYIHYNKWNREQKPCLKRIRKKSGAYPSGIDFCLYVPPPEPVSLEDDKLLGELRHCCDLAKAMDETVT